MGIGVCLHWCNTCVPGAWRERLKETTRFLGAGVTEPCEVAVLRTSLGLWKSNKCSNCSVISPAPKAVFRNYGFGGGIRVSLGDGR